MKYNRANMMAGRIARSLAGKFGVRDVEDIQAAIMLSWTESGLFDESGSIDDANGGLAYRVGKRRGIDYCLKEVCFLKNVKRIISSAGCGGEMERG